MAPELDILSSLKIDFNGHIDLRQKRHGVLQVIAPLFHEDGDMVDIFVDLADGDKPMRLSDHGMTLMRLSYSYEIDSPAKRKILDRILSENGIKDERGRFVMDTAHETIYTDMLQFAQAIAKVSSMQAFKREVVQSLFYEQLGSYVESVLAPYLPQPRYMPIQERDDLEVDWKFTLRVDIFLFGVKDDSRARLAALACREFQIKGIPFRSVIVHQDFESGLTKKDQARITNVADKQFTSLADFTSNGEAYFARESMLVQ